MLTPYESAVARATQAQASMWAREASELRDHLHNTRPGPLADYRRARCIVAQTNAAVYHSWVARDLSKA